jgi:uncharacterized protein YndB with AHSA1/START domain
MKIKEAATFRAPVSRVFPLIADGSQAIRWVSGVVSSQRVGEPAGAPVGVGSRFQWIVQLGPFLREENAQEITSFQPNQEIGFRATAGMPVEGHWLFHEHDGMTEVTYEATASMEGRRLGRLMGSRIGQEIWASSLRTSLERLRKLVESANV